VTEHSFSRAWSTIPAERQAARNGGDVRTDRLDGGNGP
jgi:hypothetical protein